MPILARAAGENSLPIFDCQVMLRWRAVNAAAFVTLLVSGTDGGQVTATIQDFRQHAAIAHMHNNKNRSIDVLGQMLCHFAQSFYAASRRADDNDVAFGHERSRPS